MTFRTLLVIKAAVCRVFGYLLLAPASLPFRAGQAPPAA
jgi:hypothetical protein